MLASLSGQSSVSVERYKQAFDMGFHVQAVRLHFRARVPPLGSVASSQAYLCKPCSLPFFCAGGAGLLGDCNWGRGGGGLPVPQNEAGPAKGDECDEQRK